MSETSNINKSEMGAVRPSTAGVLVGSSSVAIGWRYGGSAVRTAAVVCLLGSVFAFGCESAEVEIADGHSDAEMVRDVGESEFATYCQDIVDAFHALYKGLGVPGHLEVKTALRWKTGEEFDPNEFFLVLDRLKMEAGWTLDYFYGYEVDVGGAPKLVARTTQSSVCQSDPERPCVWEENVLHHVQVDGTREGWFQLMVLRLMGDQFYRTWHHYEGKEILPSQAGLTAWVEEQSDWYGDAFDGTALAAIPVTPLIGISEEGVRVEMVYFSTPSGIGRWIADLSLVPPYAPLPGTQSRFETLLECSWCGIP